MVEHTKGPERRTPNKFDFILYLSNPGTIKMEERKETAVRRLDAPNIPNCFLLANVLSHEYVNIYNTNQKVGLPLPVLLGIKSRLTNFANYLYSECRQIVAATEAIGYTGDAPLVGVASESVSVLAHNFFWLADEQFLATLYDRCKAFLPPVMGGGEVLGLNARFRVYRYVPGAIYRVWVVWCGLLHSRACCIIACCLLRAACACYMLCAACYVLLRAVCCMLCARCMASYIC